MFNHTDAACEETDGTKLESKKVISKVLFTVNLFPTPLKIEFSIEFLFQFFKVMSKFPRYL